MPGRRPATRLLVAAALALLAAAATALPWWRSGPPTPDGWAGWEVVGLPVTAVLAVLALAAAAALLLRPAAARLLLTASGAAAVAAAATALVAWGGTAVPGPFLTGAAGLGVLVLVLRPPGPAVLACALVAAVGTAVLPGGSRPAEPVADGPYLRLAQLDAGRALRSGEPVLPLTLTTRGAGLGEVDGEPVVFGPAGVVGVDAYGRARVVTRLDGDTVLGVAGGRIAQLVDGDALTVGGLTPADPARVRVEGVRTASPVGTDGSVWLVAEADPPGVVRRLDLDAYDGPQDLAAVYLPVVTVRVPDGAARIDIAEVLPTAGGAALRIVSDPNGDRLERLTPTGTGVDVEVLAGALDPACGLNSGARTSVLSPGGPVTVDAVGGIWLVLDDRLARIDPSGVLRVVPTPLPGTVSALLTMPDGAIVLGAATPNALWRLPDPAAALVDLPPAPGDCVAAPPAVGPPVALVPLANTDGDRLGVPLGVDGRWASGRYGGDLAVVGPDGTVPLGPRLDRYLGQVWPDGAGGAWWLEVGGPDEELLTLVHARPGGEQVRSAPVAHPSPREGSRLIPDLGGRPPLLGTAAGAFRIDGGRAVRVVEGAVDGGVVRADGRGWVLAGGRLLALDGDRVLGAVIAPAAGADAAVPVAVQLAKGVPPDRLALPDASVGLDAGGRAVVVSGGVVLRIDDGGSVAVVAQDPRLVAPLTVEGGLVQVDGRTLLRVDLP